MNNKAKTVTFCDLGAIVKKLKTLRVNNMSSREILDIRVQLATIWLNQAKKMQRFKNLNSKLYSYHVIEDDLILSAIEVFEKTNHFLQSKT